VTRLLPLLVLGFSLTGPLAAQDLETVLGRSSYPVADRTLVAAMVHRAADEGIPESFLLPRIDEAVAKGVSADRLAAVLSLEIEDYRQARSILEHQDRPVEAPVWQRSALLLRSGVGPAQLEGLIHAWAARWKDYLAGTAVLFPLHDWGLTWAEALAVGGALATTPLEASNFPYLLSVLAEARQSPGANALVPRVIQALAMAKTIPALRREVSRP
jgi:hypothetical protein